MKRHLALLLLACLSCGPGDRGGDGSAPVEERDVALRCDGEGSPTVVIDAGLGESAADWSDIAEDLRETVQVCTFDRAGYGGSDPGPMPRTPAANAEDLNRALARAGVARPIVLVGHSLGALNAQAYWRAYPEDVAGLVLLDPPPRAWLERRRFPGLWEMAVSAGEELARVSEAASAAGSPEADRLSAMASEHNAMLQFGAEVVGIESFEGLPLLVVAAGRPNPAFGDSAVAYQELWIEENRRLASRSRGGRVHVLDSVGHSMNHEAPATLVALIRAFVADM